MRNKAYKLTKIRILIPLLLCPAALGACEAKGETVISAEDFFLPGEASAEEALAESSPQERICYVHVCGAVQREGVYELPEGARVFEAIDAAGGLLEDADASAVNQAQPVTDGSRVRIPFAGEMPEGTAPFTANPAAGGLIDINTASAAELQKLTGIGEKRAQDIIRYRETHGAFLKIEDIMQVDGIKEKLFEQIREQITV